MGELETDGVPEIVGLMESVGVREKVFEGVEETVGVGDDVGVLVVVTVGVVEGVTVCARAGLGVHTNTTLRRTWSRRMTLD